MKTVKISLRPLQVNDLPLMHRWLNTPHVSQWWNLDGNHHPTPEEVNRKYSPRIAGKEPVNCYIIHYGGKPIGMIQCYDLDDYPAEKETFGVAGKCTGIDIFIGEEEYVHQGLGSSIIRTFLTEVVFANPETQYAMIDPYIENEIAIKAYQKAGFRYLKTVWYETDQAREAIYTIRRNEIEE